MEFTYFSKCYTFTLLYKYLHAIIQIYLYPHSSLPVKILNTALRLSILRSLLVGPERSRKKAIRLKAIPMKQREIILRITCATLGDTQSTSTEM